MKKVVLVTGSATGFGFEIAKRFAAEGWKVYATVKEIAYDSNRLEKFANEGGYDLTVLKLDVTRQSDIDLSVAKVVKESGKIDVLVNNAGFGFLGPVEEFSIEEVKAQFEVNFFGVVRLNKRIVPIMRDNGGGRIINISSINGLVSIPLYGVYSASKFSLETLSEVQRFELAPFGIKVSLVEPGAFTTRFSDNRQTPEAMLKADSPYAQWAPSAVERIMRQGEMRGKLMRGLMSPSRVANLVWKIANKRNPKLRYRIGTLTGFLYYGTRLVPYSVRSWIMSKTLRWG